MKAKYFTLAEMLESQTARRLKIVEQFEPPADIVANLEELCKYILDPLREAAGPLKISSGYRCPKVNKLVKGAGSSQHIKGQAADLHPVEMTHKALFELILKLNLPFDQMIWEYGTMQEPAWVHISYGPLQRRQVLHIGQ